MGASCDRCGHENRVGRKFCATCGAPLAIACDQCAFANHPGERFCGGCGTALIDDSTLVRRPGELRQVVVVFADLAEYTRLSGRLAPEDVHGLLGRFFDVVDGTVAEHGGTIDKHIGDNVMALFGAPIAHGNDAQRAVRAALAMHERVDRLGEELSLMLRLSIGIAAGQVMASGLGSAHHREYTVIGSSVNLAARLQGRAATGETLIDDSVHRAVEAVIDAEPLEPLELKGIDTPVRAWRVRAMRAARAVRRPMVGRERERELLQRVIAQSATATQGAVIVIRGEPGIGKSRLAAEAASIARAARLRVHRTHYLDFASGSGGVGAILPELIEDGWRDGARAADPRLHAALTDVLGDPIPDDYALQYRELDNATRSAARRDAIASAVTDASRHRPRLVMIEDLHWCPADELALVSGLIAATLTSPLVVLTTTRPDEPGIHESPWQVANSGAQLLELDLEPLTAEHSHQLAAMLGADHDLARTAVERAGGNPLFVEELVAAAGERGDSDPLPGTVQSLILARLDRLPARDRRALQVASALGSRFAPGSLAALLDDPKYDASEPIRRGLLTRAGDELMFRHALIREGVYGSLPREGRRELHTRAADLLGSTDPSTRAHHLDKAGDTRAANAYLAAAQMEADAYRIASALELAARACELAAPALRYDAELRRAELLGQLGEARAATDGYRAAEDAAGTDADRCRAALGLAAAYRALSDYAPGLAALARVETLATTDRERVELHYHRAALYFAQSRMSASTVEATRALALADQLGDPSWRVRALSAIGDAEWGGGSMARAAQHFAGCAALCDELGMTRFGVLNRAMLGQALIWVGRPAEGMSELERALGDASELQDRFCEMFAHHSIALGLQDAGQFSRAEDEARQALELARAIGSSRFEYEILTQLGEIEMVTGRGGIDLARSALALARERNVLAYCGPWTLGLIAATTDEAGERAAALAEGEALLDDDGAQFNHILFYRLATHAAVRAGDPALAHGYAARCRARMDDAQVELWRTELNAHLAAAAIHDDSDH